MIVDTPINRASIENLPIEEVQAYVATLQERRLRSYSIYQAAQEAKLEKQSNQHQADLVKRLDQFEKKHQSVLKGLEALEKYALDILGLRIALGHDISRKDNS